jgi:heparosan-N-sulfate-glucuronate 5-epimerase
MLRRLRYLRRIAAAYLLPGNSHLTFWHDVPEVNARAFSSPDGGYYMTFGAKADYAGPFDDNGIPQLDYRGALGRHYNPIAIAQYGLGNFNRFKETGDPERRKKFLRVADWLRNNLEKNPAGCSVWNHHFDWEYRTPLKAPWYSGLAQGQGLSVLVRAHRETGDPAYLEAARRAFEPFTRGIAEGGVIARDDRGRAWIEEYIVEPPTHILNGFVWASWGIYDYLLATGEAAPRKVWEESVGTLREELPTYDAGFWSLYEHSGTWMRMIASRFYHRLHVVQLRVMHRLSGDLIFAETADRWEKYGASRWNRTRAGIHKALFKLCYY